MSKNNATLKGKQRDNVNNAKPPSSFCCWCRNLKSKKTMGGGNSLVKMSVKHGAKVLRFFVPIMSKNTPSVHKKYT